jgi:hypothetical protein
MRAKFELLKIILVESSAEIRTITYSGREFWNSQKFTILDYLKVLSIEMYLEIKVVSK